MKILFISRAFPPITGGIENQNAALAQWLPKFAEIDLIINHGGKLALPWFLPFAFLRACVSMFRADVLLLGDGVLGIVGAGIKYCFPHKTVVTVLHGLDLTYSNSFYQRFWVHGFLRNLDGYLCVSSHTKTQAIEHGLRAARCFVIPNGVETERFHGKRNRPALEALLGRSLEGKIVLLTIGRLAKRKGVSWFVTHVLPKLNGNILYAVAGAGPEELAIQEARTATHTEERVILLGRIPEETVCTLLNASDIFVQPNIRVKGDMEGFGIAVIEAGSAGLPVVASDLEGLRDAVIPGRNGLLVKPEEAEGFVTTLNELSERNDERKLFGEQAAQFVSQTFHWNHIAERYVSTLDQIMRHAKKR